MEEVIITEVELLTQISEKLDYLLEFIAQIQIVVVQSFVVAITVIILLILYKFISTFI